LIIARNQVAQDAVVCNLSTTFYFHYFLNFKQIMAYWLLKTEPQEYSWQDLEQQGHTVWNGVKNPLALKYLRIMQPGDEALIYHTGKERQIVGVAQIMTLAYPDPKLEDSKLVVVEIQPRRSLPKPVSLTQIKQSEEFTSFDLIRLPRLSVVPVSAEYWQRILQLAAVE
jgi:predicted RNA-binding protein with PUA-like domain